MKEIDKRTNAFAVITKDRREVTAFGEGDVDALSVHFTKSDAEQVASQSINLIVVPCKVVYRTLVA